MADLTNPKLIWLKGWLFLLIGSIASTLILLETTSWKVAGLLALTVWAFCRFYYFAFYVIEKYVDSSHRFTGLVAFLRYAIGNRPGQRSGRDPSSSSDE